MAEKNKNRVLLLLNAASGTGKVQNSALRIIKGFAQSGYEPIVYPILPKTKFEAEEILAGYDGNIELVVCAGGDGTLNHVTNAVMSMKNKPRLGYIPAGSTNDFARSLKLPFDTDTACNAIISGDVFMCDTGKINDRYFNYIAAFGAFSETSYTTSQDFKNIFGHAAYIVSGAAELSKNIGYSRRVKIECDDFCEEDNYLFGAVCNSLSIGGTNILKYEDIAFDDGKMELLLIKAPSNRADFHMILSSLRKHELNNPYISFRQVSEVTFTSAERLEWAVDGEYGGGYTDAKIKVMPKSIKLMR